MQCDICNVEEVMSIYVPLSGIVEFTHCSECELLLDIVEEALSIARCVGVPKYGSSSWSDVPTNEHLNHAIAHVQLAYALKDNIGDHLAHAICRLAMAKALIEE